jgi:hypothetical protein
VLFNRQYQPIWQRSPGEKVRSNVSDEWVPYEGQFWFYDDGCTPWLNRESRRCCLEVLRRWDVEGLSSSHWFYEFCRSGAAIKLRLKPQGTYSYFEGDGHVAFYQNL